MAVETKRNEGYVGCKTFEDFALVFLSGYRKPHIFEGRINGDKVVVCATRIDLSYIRYINDKFVSGVGLTETKHIDKNGDYSIEYNIYNKDEVFDNTDVGFVNFIVDTLDTSNTKENE